MPLPRALARFNRHVTNRLTRPLARWLPGFAIVRHVGQSSGRTYRTPVNVFIDGDRCTFALTYGAQALWVRNVLAAGACEIETGGHTLHLVEPRIVDDPARGQVPAPVRALLRLIDVSTFLRMQIAVGRG